MGNRTMLFAHPAKIRDQEIYRAALKFDIYPGIGSKEHIKF